jgi:hypothetical protein
VLARRTWAALWATALLACDVEETFLPLPAHDRAASFVLGVRDGPGAFSFVARDVGAGARALGSEGSDIVLLFYGESLAELGVEPGLFRGSGPCALLEPMAVFTAELSASIDWTEAAIGEDLRRALVGDAPCMELFPPCAALTSDVIDVVEAPRGAITAMVPLEGDRMLVTADLPGPGFYVLEPSLEVSPIDLPIGVVRGAARSEDVIWLLTSAGEVYRGDPTLAFVRVSTAAPAGKRAWMAATESGFIGMSSDDIDTTFFGFDGVRHETIGVWPGGTRAGGVAVSGGLVAGLRNPSSVIESDAGGWTSVSIDLGGEDEVWVLTTLADGRLVLITEKGQVQVRTAGVWSEPPIDSGAERPLRAKGLAVYRDGLIVTDARGAYREWRSRGGWCPPGPDVAARHAEAWRDGVLFGTSGDSGFVRLHYVR